MRTSISASGGRSDIWYQICGMQGRNGSRVAIEKPSHTKRTMTTRPKKRVQERCEEKQANQDRASACQRWAGVETALTEWKTREEEATETQKLCLFGVDRWSVRLNSECPYSMVEPRHHADGIGVATAGRADEMSHDESPRTTCRG